MCASVWVWVYTCVLVSVSSGTWMESVLLYERVHTRASVREHVRLCVRLRALLWFGSTTPTHRKSPPSGRLSPVRSEAGIPLPDPQPGWERP